MRECPNGLAESFRKIFLARLAADDSHSFVKSHQTAGAFAPRQSFLSFHLRENEFTQISAPKCASHEKLCAAINAFMVDADTGYANWAAPQSTKLVARCNQKTAYAVACVIAFLRRVVWSGASQGIN